jgi:hypothetical protein
MLKLFVTVTTRRMHPEVRHGYFIFDRQCQCEICVSGGPSKFAASRMNRDRRHVELAEIDQSYEQLTLESGSDLPPLS